MQNDHLTFSHFSFFSGLVFVYTKEKKGERARETEREQGRLILINLCWSTERLDCVQRHTRTS